MLQIRKCASTFDALCQNLDFICFVDCSLQNDDPIKCKSFDTMDLGQYVSFVSTCDLT